MLSDSGNTLRLRSEFARHCYSGWRRWFRVIAAALILSGFVSGARAAEPVKPTAEAAKAAVPKEATLVVWDQPLRYSARRSPDSMPNSGRHKLRSAFRRCRLGLILARSKSSR